MGATKSFRPPIAGKEAIHWINTLSCELYSRVHDEFDSNKRWPKQLTFHMRKKSKVSHFPGRFNITSPSDIAKIGLDLFKTLHSDLSEECTGVSMILSQFERLETGIKGIKEFYHQQEVGDFYHCKDCGKRISVYASEEHADFHFASKLQALERKNESNPIPVKRISSTSTVGSVKKKFKPGNQITRFFKPKE